MLITFCVISYNQEDTILETLESIDYQISKDRTGKEFQLIISDDGSTDKTYFLEKQWTELKREKYEDIIVLPSDNNRGLVANLLRSYVHVSGDYYKVIAGDDLLADSDYLSILDDKDFYIFGNYMFHNYKLSPEINHYTHYCYWNSTFKQLRKYSRFLNLFQTQMWFCSSKLLVRGLYNELKDYKYLEDQPEWFYWIKNMELRFEYINIPLVLYRLSENGISNQNNQYHKAVLNDLLQLRRRMTQGMCNPIDKYISKSYELRHEFQNNFMLRNFFTWINPYEYFVRMKIIMQRNEMKKLAYELDNNS